MAILNERRQIKVITGLSGAGKSVVLRALEDIGFYCIDNLPLDTLVHAGGSLKRSGVRHIAFGIDIREKEFLKQFPEVINRLRQEGFLVEIIFLDAQETVLIRRFKETRRPHPLHYGEGSVRDAIREEKKAMDPILHLADRVLDTSSFSPHQLRSSTIRTFGEEGDFGRLRITVLSFGFKFGAPTEADIVMDVRFLPNPHFVQELRPLTGLDGPVSEFVFSQDKTREFLERFVGLLRFLLPQYQHEGKSLLNIGIGCTGGRHRSPALAEGIAGELREIEGVDVTTYHRELESG